MNNTINEECAQHILLRASGVAKQLTSFPRAAHFIFVLNKTKIPRILPDSRDDKSIYRGTTHITVNTVTQYEYHHIRSSDNGACRNSLLNQSCSRILLRSETAFVLKYRLASTADFLKLLNDA